MLCISRYTDDTYAQQFGDGRHKFYVEFRCSRPCLKGMDCCAKCAEKTDTKLQTSRKFNHCNVNEPIPDTSHIFGGKWYNNAIKKWGQPPSEIIQFALQYQKDARGSYIVEQPNYDESSKANNHYTSKEMPRAKSEKLDNTTSEKVPVKRARKPKVADSIENTVEVAIEPSEEKQAPIKRARKPKVAPEGDTPVEKKAPRKKAANTPYSNIINTIPQLVHKEVSLPTHIETTLEEFDTEGYTIEYVKLSLFEVGQASYFRDSIKNKLYKKIKEKGIGQYVGRWNPDTESINTDIPDSDNEN